jgi:hypothetical protein
MAGKAYNIGPTFPCPCCAQRTRLRSSEGISHTLRSLKYQCQNVECGHTFEAHLIFIRTISTSAVGPVRMNAAFRKPRMAMGVPPAPAPAASDQPPDRPPAA